MLIGQVLNVAISGVEAYALQRSDYSILQTAVTKIPRKAMCKKTVVLEWDASSGKYEVVKQIPNQCVLRYWKIATVYTELVVRRIRMYQSMAQYPEDSVLPMAAAFGKMKGEDPALANPVENGQITEDATPWAKQFAEDLRYWCRAIDDIDAMFAEYDYRFFLVFTNPLLKEAFLRADPTILRAWEQSVKIPLQSSPDSTTANTSHFPDLVYTCSQCAQSFPTHRQLRTHESMKHDVRCQANLLTPTNCCANCNTMFATRASAIQHLQHYVQQLTPHKPLNSLAWLPSIST